MHPTTKFLIRESILRFVYPDPMYIAEHPSAFNEIKQYVTNLLNLCLTRADMFDVLPEPLHSVLPKVTRNDPENTLLFNSDYLAFKIESELVNKKLNKLLTRKLLTT